MNKKNITMIFGTNFQKGDQGIIPFDVAHGPVVTQLKSASFCFSGGFFQKNLRSQITTFIFVVK